MEHFTVSRAASASPSAQDETVGVLLIARAPLGGTVVLAKSYKMMF